MFNDYNTGRTGLGMFTYHLTPCISQVTYVTEKLFFIP